MGLPAVCGRPHGNGDAGHDLVTTTRERAEHCRGILSIDWLSEHATVDEHDGVGGDHGTASRGGQHRVRLGLGDTPNVLLRQLARTQRFVGAGGPDLEVKAGSAQQIGAARRGGRQYQL